MIPTKKQESDYIKNLDFNKPLRELVDYKTVLWINNMVKTTLSTAFITASTITFTSYCTSSNIIGKSPELTLLVSLLLLILGLSVIVFIDKYKERKKREELDIVDKKIEFHNKKLLAELNDFEDANKMELKKEAIESATRLIKQEIKEFGDDNDEIN